MVNWLISSALERTDVYTAVESTARQLPAPCPRPEVIPAFTESLLQPTHMKFTGHRCWASGSNQYCSLKLHLCTASGQEVRTSQRVEAGDFRASEVSHSSRTVWSRSRGSLSIFCCPWAGQHLTYYRWFYNLQGRRRPPSLTEELTKTYSNSDLRVSQAKTGLPRRGSLLSR